MKRDNIAFVGKLAVVTSLLMALAPNLGAQTNTADVVGTVTDTSGSVVPNAVVNLVNIGTGVRQSTHANAAGEYTFSLLQVGTYSVQVEVQGFKRFRVNTVTLAAGDRVRIDAPLELATTTIFAAYGSYTVT